MNSKLSLISRAAAIAGIVALALPALAQTNPPAATPSAPATQATAPAAKSDSTVAKTSGTVEQKAKKDKTHVAKKHDGMVKTAKSDTGHKPAPVKPEAPASNAGK
jgi:apolipoprotein N-acyltransferase